MNIPIVELYEYQIHKYEPTNRYISQDTKNQVFKFGDIDDSPADECKRVTVDGYQKNEEEDTNRSSCDPIFNVGGKLEVTTYYDIDNIYGNYKLFLAKDTDTNELDLESKKKLKKNLVDALNTQYELLKHFINPSLVPFFRLANRKKLDRSNIPEINAFADETAIIQQLKINDETKIILFGDFHGSFHTFFRLLCRLHRYGILDLNTLKINDPYKIIFLGDILDRGMYALDILNIIFKLITINNKEPENQRIIFNRGNHENFDQYLYDFLTDRLDTPTTGNEIKKKINIDHENYEFIVKLNLLFSALPSAVIINNQNKYKYWCCHGGFPPDLVINLKDNIFTLINNITDAKDIRWSDFGLPDVTNTVPFGPSGRGETLKKYGMKGTLDFLERNSINYIIRGHQDSYGNSILFDDDGNKLIISDPEFDTLEDMLYYNTNPKTYNNRANGPIARLIPVYHYSNIFPVLTISTNTDNGRNLNSDSFILLRFDIKKDNIEDFTRNTLSIMQNIKETLKNKNINRNIIMKKNLETCLNIFREFNNQTNNIIRLLLIKDIFKEELNKIPKDIQEITLEINSIMEDVCEIMIYYDDKYTALRDKINLYYDKHTITKEQYDIAIRELSEYKNILDEHNDIITKIEKFNIEKEFLIKNLDEIIKNNKQKQILDEMHRYIQEFEI